MGSSWFVGAIQCLPGLLAAKRRPAGPLDEHAKLAGLPVGEIIPVADIVHARASA